nr:unnamed protein product [Trichobilharzia regenti]
MEGNSGFFMVEVKLLSDEEVPMQMEVTNDCLGRSLFNQVIERLGGIIEKDYFGLRYLDRSKQRQWLEMSKTVYKQLKYVSPRSLNFRVKHYPSDPVNEFRQEKSRYLLYLQLRRDLHSGRLIGRNLEMHVLAACILQAEIGDYNLLLDFLGPEGSLADLKMFANITPKTEAKIVEIYKSLKGMSMAEAENKFLDHASKFETYGIEPLYVQDRKGNHFYMGLNHEGVITYRGSRKAHVFNWQKINKISYEGKLFIIQVEWEQRRHTLGFKCPTPEAAEALWKWAVDRQCFFTLNRSVDAKESKANGGLFKRRQFYTFTGRCQKELMLLNSSMPAIPQPSVARSRSLLNLAKSVQSQRHSQSQNDLDRKYVDSNDNLQDSTGIGRLIKGLDHHQSSLETRRNGSGLDQMDDNLFMNKRLTDQLGGMRQQPTQKLQDQPQKSQQDNKNSLSTPNLATIPSSDNNNNESINTNTQGSPTAGVDTLSDGRKRMSQPQGEEEKPVKNTSEAGKSGLATAEQRTDSVLDSKMRKVGVNVKGLEVSSKSDFNNRQIDEGNVIDSLSSGVEGNAEATEQPIQAGNNSANCGDGDHAGSINTLSSSPLKSADEDDDVVNEELITADVKPNTDSDVYQKIKVGNWLGANGVKSFEDVQMKPSLSAEDYHQKTDNHSVSKMDEKLNTINTRASHIECNPTPRVNKLSKEPLKDYSYTDMSTTAHPVNSSLKRVEAVSETNKYQQVIKPPDNSATPNDKINKLPKKTRKEFSPVTVNTQGSDNRHSVKYISDPSPPTEFDDSKNKPNPLQTSTVSRSKSQYFNGTTSTDSKYSSSKSKVNSPALISKPEISSSSRTSGIVTSKSDLYFPYARNISTTNVPMSDRTLQSSVDVSINYQYANLPISSMKVYSESRNDIIYPKLPNSELLPSKQTQRLRVNTGDSNDQLSTTESRRTLYSSRNSTTTKDLSPQPRDWYQTTSFSTNENDRNYEGCTSIAPDISNIILDPIDDEQPKFSSSRVNTMDTGNGSTSRRSLSSDMNNKLTNGLLFENGYRPLNYDQTPSKIDSTYFTTHMNASSSYINLPNSMLEQTTNCRDLIYPSDSSSMAKATKLINASQPFFSSTSTDIFISKSQPNIVKSKSSTVQFGGSNNVYDLKPISNSLASITQSSNEGSNSRLLGSTSYLSQQNINNKKQEVSNANNDNNNNSNNSNNIQNSNRNERTAGSSAAHLAAMGVGAYKLGDSLALLTTRADHLIGPNMSNTTNNEYSDSTVNRSNVKSVSFNTANNNMKNQTYQVNVKQPLQSSFSSISTKPSSIVQSVSLPKTSSQLKENNDDVDGDSGKTSQVNYYYKSEELGSSRSSFEDNTALQSMVRVTDRVQHFMSLTDQVKSEKSLNELTKNLPPLAVKSSQTDWTSSQASSPQSIDSKLLESTSSSALPNETSINESDTQLLSFIQQLFYYFIVGFIVYKIMSWLNLRPTFG